MVWPEIWIVLHDPKVVQPSKEHFQTKMQIIILDLTKYW